MSRGGGVGNGGEAKWKEGEVEGRGRIEKQAVECREKWSGREM